MANGDWPSPQLWNPWATTAPPGQVMSPLPLLLGGWQCPGCLRCYAPSVTACPDCPQREPGMAERPGFTADDRAVAQYGIGGTLDRLMADEDRKVLGAPCPPSAEGGMCGCDEDG